MQGYYVEMKVAAYLLTMFLTVFAFAGTVNHTHQQSDWAWLGTLSSGPIWGQGGETQSFYLTPEIDKAYVAKQSTSVFVNGEVFLGLQKKLPHFFLGQLGLAVASTSNVPLSGEIWDEADPVFANYNYTYKIQHAHVAVKGKLLADLGFWVTPWVSASAGVGFNKAYAFTNTTTIFEAVANPNFITNTQAAFTYTVDLGIQKALSDRWQIAVSYEFADWGKSRLGRAPEQTLNSGLKLGHLYTNGILFGLTYMP